MGVGAARRRQLGLLAERQGRHPEALRLQVRQHGAVQGAQLRRAELGACVFLFVFAGGRARAPTGLLQLRRGPRRALLLCCRLLPGATPRKRRQLLPGQGQLVARLRQLLLPLVGHLDKQRA